MSDTLLIETQASGITILTFNRPESRNALNLETMHHFADAVTQLTDDPNLRVVILTGAGTEAFCSGGDLRELSEYTSQQDALDMVALMGDALLTLERLPVPVIAAINGYALGGGSEIALACDLRVMDEKVRFGLVQVRLALTPGWGAGQRLMRLIGYSRAMDILLRGHVMHAPEIESLGLANRVVEAGTALAHALNLAGHIAQTPAPVVAGIKALLQAGLHQPYDAALQVERAIFPPLWAAEPHLKAVEDFLRKQ